VFCKAAIFSPLVLTKSSVQDFAQFVNGVSNRPRWAVLNRVVSGSEKKDTRRPSSAVPCVPTVPVVPSKAQTPAVRDCSTQDERLLRNSLRDMTSSADLKLSMAFLLLDGCKKIVHSLASARRQKGNKTPLSRSNGRARSSDAPKALFNHDREEHGVNNGGYCSIA